jgi:hypothetical protein
MAAVLLCFSAQMGFAMFCHIQSPTCPNVATGLPVCCCLMVSIK